MAEPAGESVPERAPADSRAARRRTFAVVNFKGGVGKTTAALNLGVAWAARGLRVLLVDLDPNATLTTTLGVSAAGPDPRGQTVQRYLLREHERPLTSVVRPTQYGLDLVPANHFLYEVPYQIRNNPNWGRELARVLAEVPDYDVVVLDCPPEGDTFTYLALGAATDALVVLQPEGAAVWSTKTMARHIERIRTEVNPGLERYRLLVNMVTPRTELSQQMLAGLRAGFDGAVCKTTVPRTVRLAEAMTLNRPIAAHDPKSPAAVAFQELACELLDLKGEQP